MRVFAVIGSAWGDEAKGAAVDKLASLCPEAVIIRHNGGGQAGHTVQVHNSRHVFSHFGAGAFSGCPTYLGPEFVVNPKVFRIEHEELADKDVKPKVFVHPDAVVTLPCDVTFNRLIERKRGPARHGSVGIGFGETIERTSRGFPLRVKDLASDRSAPNIAAILSKWRHARGEELGFPWPEYVEDIGDWKLYRQDCEYFMDHVTVANPIDLPHNGIFIFEGAQGLLLDQTHGVTFPYVTRSNTGLTNVIPLCQQWGIDKLKTVYMHRPYLTRHGAGPMQGEDLWNTVKDDFTIVDKTNKTGEWQGSLRFAPFHKQLILNAISIDLQNAGNAVKIDYYSGRSCLDQAHNLGSVIDLGIEPALYGFGPSRSDYKVEEKFLGG